MTTLPQDTLRRIVGPAGVGPLEALRDVVRQEPAIEDFRPLDECLEWRLAEVYWERGGALPFVRNDVPYLVNNTGRLSENNAALIFTALTEVREALRERFTLLELGAGTGLHARYFLDAFASRCRQERSDLYDRLTYVVTDRFERSVTNWSRDGLFAEHVGHVELRVCDARAPGVQTLPGGLPAPPVADPFAVFCNYLLDVLPASIVRRSTAGFEELCVRTHLTDGGGALRAAGIASLDEVRALVGSGRAADLSRLLPLMPELELETAYRPWTPATPAEQALSAAIPDGGERVIINEGALTCLDSLLHQVHRSGFVLVNDYGPVRADDVSTHVGVQRFGGSVALGLNFPLLERLLRARGLTVLAPDGDEQRRVHTRLIGRRIGDGTREIFRRRFSLASDRHLDGPQEEARQHLQAGRRTEALAAYRSLIELNRGDWQMLGEAAEYVGLQLGDHAAGLALAGAALERNPWFSAWLWNILGDCLFYKERLGDAHEAFTQAQRIDPDDPRTNLNLAYTLSVRGDQAGALAALAHGLAHDGHGLYRPRLLEKQAQVLALLSERASAEQRRLVRRAERFG